MKFVITGGAGFIGSAVIRHIINNTDHSVVNIDKLTYAGNLESLESVKNDNRYSFEQVDICDVNEVKRVFNEHQPNVVMHLAAESHVDRSIDGPGEFIQTNIVGTYVLLEEARDYWNNLEGNKKEDFCKEMLNSLKRTAPLIQNHKVKFTNKSYLSFRPSNKFIYCDPPYQQGKYPIKYRRDTKFYDTFDNVEFWDVMRKWSKTNFVVISELNAPHDFFPIWQQQSYRSAAQSKKTRFNNLNFTSDTHKTEKLFLLSSSFLFLS